MGSNLSDSNFSILSLSSVLILQENEIRVNHTYYMYLFISKGDPVLAKSSSSYEKINLSYLAHFPFLKLNSKF